MDFTYLTLAADPKTLYHYTSLEALISIVQTKRLRATSIRFLNDQSESLRLKEGVIAILRKRASSSEDPKLFEDLIKAIETTPQQALFVASLSEKSDLLSQWRAYCPSGVGVSIGFSSDALKEQWIANPGGGEPFFLSASLQRVKYYAPDHESDLEKTVDRILELERKAGSISAVAAIAINEVFPDDLIKKWIQVAAQVEGEPGFNLSPPPLSALAAWVSLLSPFVKHDAFAEECEWRKVVSKQYRKMPGQKFRQGKSTLIPFVEIMLDVTTAGAERVPREKFFIDEVVIGPTPTPDLTLEAVRSLFDSEGHPEVTVRSSRIPFRSW